jgi:hypothetical protein
MKTSNLDDNWTVQDVNTLFRFTAKTVQIATPFSAFAVLKQSSKAVNPSLDARRKYIYARVFGTKPAYFCLIYRS